MDGLTMADLKHAAMLLMLAALLGLSGGCRTAQPAPDLWPVAGPCPAAPALARPDLPLQSVTESTSDADTAKAFAATLEVLRGYARELEKLLDAYR